MVFLHKSMSFYNDKSLNIASWNPVSVAPAILVTRRDGEDYKEKNWILKYIAYT